MMPRRLYYFHIGPSQNRSKLIGAPHMLTNSEKRRMRPVDVIDDR
jgi:hypothetical protein